MTAGDMIQIFERYWSAMADCPMLVFAVARPQIIHIRRTISRAE